jgi:biopolymer transport protein ExbD
MRFRRARRGPPQLDITPVVDTVFNLMIFFALSLNFISVPGIPVNLPRASSYTEAQQQRELTVAITREGRLFLDGKATTRGTLEEEMRRRQAEAPDTLVIINADTDARHGGVVEVMDLARTAGLSRLAIATQPRPEQR